jgi:hypothetical protein
MSSFRDHTVRQIAREDVARFALEWWKLADRRGAYFDICDFVLNVLRKRFRKKGDLEVKFYESEDDLPDRACVTFQPVVLHIVRKIWDDAKLGYAYARFIIAHEIGHIVLHDQSAVGFSDDNEALIKFRNRDESAEGQANDFADLFLVPDHIALRFQAEDTIATLAVVSDEMAKRRLKDARNEKHPLMPTYEGEMCGMCGNFTVARNGNTIKCDTCGSTTGCL